MIHRQPSPFYLIRSRSSGSFSVAKNCSPATWVLLATLVLSSCSVINVHENGVRVKQHFGLPIYSLQATSIDSAAYIENQGFGLISGPTGLSLGYVNETWLTLPRDQCKAVFINSSAEAVKELLATLKSAKTDINTVCIYPVQGALHE